MAREVDARRRNADGLGPAGREIALDDRAGAKAYAARKAARARQTRDPDASVETVEAYAKRWLDDREGRVNSIRDDRSRLRDHVLPTIGPLDARTFTRDDVESLRDALDEKIASGALAWKTVECVWTLVTSMCGDMVTAKKRELRMRDDNPCRDVKPPERGIRKAKQYLYPSRVPDVRVVQGRAAALASRGRARDLHVHARRRASGAPMAGDVDLAHGVLSITRALNRRTGMVEVDEVGRDAAGSPSSRTCFRSFDSCTSRQGRNGARVRAGRDAHVSRTFRRWLAKAGVTGPAARDGTPTSKPLTWHDLRATGATWMAVRGDDPLKIKQRCGHADVLHDARSTSGRPRPSGRGSATCFPDAPAVPARNRPRIARGDSFSRSSLKQG